MDFTPSAHQAAGHDGCLTAGPIFAKLTTAQEVAFYQESTDRASDADLGSHLSHWMPTYMGTLQQGDVNVPNPAAHSEKLYLVLQNMYHGFRKPSILDIKLGAVLLDDRATEEKRQRLAKVSRDTTSGSLSFRICGMKLYCGESGETLPSVYPGMEETVDVENTSDGKYLKFNKIYGRSLTPNNVKEGILQYFAFCTHRRLLLTRFHQRLQLLYNCLLDSEVRIKAGSLFLIYENDLLAWAGVELEEAYFENDPLVNEPLDDSDDEEEEDVIERIAPLSSLSFIDFAHAKHVDGEGPDENVITGVENLINIFGELLEES